MNWLDTFFDYTWFTLVLKPRDNVIDLLFCCTINTIIRVATVSAIILWFKWLL